MPTYDIEVTRDGRRWMIHIPALDGLTQARFPEEIEDMACSHIALVTDTPIENVAVRPPSNEPRPRRPSRMTCRRKDALAEALTF